MIERATHVVTRLDAPLRGRIVPPPDKSITHRALFFGALNGAPTTILSPSLAADPLSTRSLLQAIGYRIDDIAGGWHVRASKGESVETVERVLDCGNSGTTARLAAGFLTGEVGAFRLVGDHTLSRRPMERVARPLRSIGANITTVDGAMPIDIVARGGVDGSNGEAIDVASAQIHAALALAGLRSRSGVRLNRTKGMRDHTSRMAALFGALFTSLNPSTDVIEPRAIDCELTLSIPGDLSSAAFPIVAALLVPGSSILVDDVGLNPTRTAVLNLLHRMGADIESTVVREEWEPVGRIEVRASPLSAIDVGVDGDIDVGELIDELPIIALAMSQAYGRSVVRGAAELRVKESDRIGALVSMMRALGVRMEEFEDGFAVEGPQPIAGGCIVDHHDDHRLLMVAAIAGLIAERPVTIPNPAIADVSYPTFFDDLERLREGAR